MRAGEDPSFDRTAYNFSLVPFRFKLLDCCRNIAAGRNLKICSVVPPPRVAFKVKIPGGGPQEHSDPLGVVPLRSVSAKNTAQNGTDRVK